MFKFAIKFINQLRNIWINGIVKIILTRISKLTLFLIWWYPLNIIILIVFKLKIKNYIIISVFALKNEPSCRRHLNVYWAYEVILFLSEHINNSLIFLWMLVERKRNHLEKRALNTHAQMWVRCVRQVYFEKRKRKACCYRIFNSWKSG